MSDDVIRKLAGSQRRRFVAGILGAAEQSPWWGKLSAAEQRALREKVLLSAGIYHDFMLDVIAVTHENVLQNDKALELIQQISDNQRALLEERGRRG